MDEFMSVPKIAVKIGAVENMVRRYIARFPEFFTFRVSEGVKRYPPEALEVINRISELYQEGKKREEIREALKKDFQPSKEIQKDEQPIRRVSDVRAVRKGKKETGILEQILTELKEIKEEIRKMNRTELREPKEEIGKPDSSEEK